MIRIANFILTMMVLIPAAAGQVCVRHLQVPEYPPTARAAQWKGVADLTITVGARGQVVNVEGKGSLPILVDHAKENVKSWVFCDPKKNGNAHVQLRYDYRLEGAPVYPGPPAKVVIDSGEGTVVITSPPGELQP
jgi:hypothetical protein